MEGLNHDTVEKGAIFVMLGFSATNATAEPLIPLQLVWNRLDRCSGRFHKHRVIGDADY
jgi:hypothetical protein